MNRKWLLAGTLVAGLAIALAGVATAWPAAAQDAHHGGQTTAPTIATVEQAQQQATTYLVQIGLSNLTIGEVVPFANSFYVAIVDPATKNGAFELLVNRTTGVVHPEPGPTMMWNTEYSPMFGTKGDLLRGAMQSGMMDSMTGDGTGSDMMDGMSGGMMDGMSSMMGGSTTGMMGNGNGMMDEDMSGDGHGMMDQETMGYLAGAAEPLAQPLTTDAALAQAQTFLTKQGSPATATDPIAFPGYVTVKIARDGQVAGLLSVQTSTGAIWQHVWYGVIG